MSDNKIETNDLTARPERESIRLTHAALMPQNLSNTIQFYVDRMSRSKRFVI